MKNTVWTDLNRSLEDGQSVDVKSGLFFGTYTRKGEAGEWTNLQHPKGTFVAEVINKLRRKLVEDK